MQLWYTCKENELNGPFTESEIQTLLENKSLAASDWIRKEDEASWTLVSEHQRSHAFFNDLEAMPEASPRHWVVLKYQEGEGEQPMQKGPYTNLEILNQIYKGELEYSDFVWKEGFNEWRRIGSLSDFIPKVKTEEKERKEEPIVEAKASLEHVMKHKVNENTYYQKVFNFEVEPTKKNDLSQQSFLQKKKEDIPSYFRPKKNKKKKWWFLSFFCLFLSVFIAVWGRTGLALYL